MASNSFEERKDIIPFPENIQYDINIGEFSFDYWRAFQTLLIVVVFGVIAFLLLQLTPLKWTYKGVIMLAVIVGSAVLGIKGINGDSVFGYIYNKIIFLKNKRVCYYNPRIKTEIKFFTNSDGSEDYIAPREKIEEMYHKFISKTDIKSAQENLKQEELDTSYMYFEDDIDALGKPEELMSKKELKKYQKKKAKEEKRLQREINKQQEKGGLFNVFKKKESKGKERKVAGL